MLENCRGHLVEASETYLEHLFFAAGVGLMLIGAGLACLIHALVPAFCERTASRMVHRMTVLFSDRGNLNGAFGDTSGAITLVGLLAMCTPVWIITVSQPQAPLLIAMALLSTAIPIAYLLTNPQLEPV